MHYRTTEYLFCTNYLIITGPKKREEIPNVAYSCIETGRVKIFGQMNIIKHIIIL